MKITRKKEEFRKNYEKTVNNFKAARLQKNIRKTLKEYWKIKKF